MEMLFNALNNIAFEYFIGIQAHRGLAHRVKLFILSEAFSMFFFLLLGFKLSRFFSLYPCREADP